MITKKDLDEAIMECKGKRMPDANTCMKLAAFYTIRQNLYPDKPSTSPEPRFEENYSYTPAPAVMYSGNSEFARAVDGKDTGDVMAIIDELMETLKVLNPRLYSGVMRRLQR